MQIPIHHPLKTWPGPFSAVKRGIKTAEFRYNDRGFHAGDYLLLREWCPKHGYSGESVIRKVTHVVVDSRFGIPEGYAMLSIAPLTWSERLVLEFAKWPILVSTFAKQ
jgi:hypothetical protein